MQAQAMLSQMFLKVRRKFRLRDHSGQYIDKAAVTSDNDVVESPELWSNLKMFNVGEQ